MLYAPLSLLLDYYSTQTFKIMYYLLASNKIKTPTKVPAIKYFVMSSFCAIPNFKRLSIDNKIHGAIKRCTRHLCPKWFN